MIILPWLRSVNFSNMKTFQNPGMNLAFLLFLFCFSLRAEWKNTASNPRRKRSVISRKCILLVIAKEGECSSLTSYMIRSWYWWTSLRTKWVWGNTAINNCLNQPRIQSVDYRSLDFIKRESPVNVRQALKVIEDFPLDRSFM